jgi:hydrogenase maturation protease
LSARRARVLLLGIGNPARQDDGLGPALAARIEALGLAEVTVDANYQLSVEDAATVARYDAVIFADAAVEGPEPFYFRRLEPAGDASFSSHSVTPAAVLKLAREMFAGEADAFVLGIRGYAFEMFVETLTDRAAANLTAAVAWLAPVLRAGSWADAARAGTMVETH